jgi:hypothetical protein
MSNESVSDLTGGQAMADDALAQVCDGVPKVREALTDAELEQVAGGSDGPGGPTDGTGAR